MQLQSPPEAEFGTASVLGCEIRYLRSGQGRPLVLLHTLRTQLEYFGPLLRELGPGLEAIVPDLPGHGRSAAPRADYTADYFLETTERLLEAWGLEDAVLVGESIGGTIALGVAAHGNPRVSRVVALNPYDYGRWGGIRRSSALAKILFTAMLWPGIGSIVARAGTKGVLRRVLEGGLREPGRLPPQLLEDLHQCGALPGHAGAFRSLCLHWRSWIAARSRYGAIGVPVVLAYGQHDWSRPEEREANARAIPGTRMVSLGECGHFSSLEKPRDVARLIKEEVSCPGRG